MFLSGMRLPPIEIYGSISMRTSFMLFAGFRSRRFRFSGVIHIWAVSLQSWAPEALRRHPTLLGVDRDAWFPQKQIQHLRRLARSVFQSPLRSCAQAVSGSSEART